MTQLLSLAEMTALPPESDRFRYGFREVRRRRPDGTYEMLSLPLTLWDVLHPQETDKPMQGLRHSKECRYLFSVLEHQFAGDPHTLVFHDVGVYWDYTGISHHSPDISVIFHVDRQRDDWPSFHVAVEGVRPALIIEVVSPATRENDVVTKMYDYHRAELPCYVIIDRQREEDWPTLLGFRWTVDRFEPIPLDAQGSLPLDVVGLKLGTIQNRVVLYDQAGKELGDYNAICEELEAEVTARKAAEARTLEEVGRRRAAEEQARAAEEQARAAEEQARREAILRVNLEQRLQELQAELLRRQSGGSVEPQG